MKRYIDKLIIHCSCSDILAHDNPETIRKWHVEENGWDDVGYHFIITKDGKIHWCRPMVEVGAHCKGHNLTSIGICLTGEYKFSREQKDSLKILTENLKDLFNLENRHLWEHRSFNKKKTCPNFDLEEFLAA